MKTSVLAVLAVASSAFGQRPSNTSICDYYANALLGASNATTQKTLLTLVVNTAVIGNYTTPNKLAVPGILSPNATYNGTKVNLAAYFDGTLASTNTGKMQGMSVNFLDGGGAKPLMNNKPANSKDSRQYALLTHLYSYFGLLLGCSDVAKPGFPAYKGDLSMYEVHKFMALDAYEVQYFIEQVGLSAASFGVTMEDVQAVGESLQSTFGLKCSPKTSVPPSAPAKLQAICIADNCPESPNSTCNAYDEVMKPSGGEDMPTETSAGSGGETATPTGVAPPPNAAAAIGVPCGSLMILAALSLLWI